MVFLMYLVTAALMLIAAQAFSFITRRFQNLSLAMKSARASFQWGISGKEERRSAILSSLEFFGLGAGRGNSSVVQGSTFWFLPVSLKIS
jgi:hypothetical protein